MSYKLENQVYKAIDLFSEKKKLDQETKEFILSLVEAASRMATHHDICIGMTMAWLLVLLQILLLQRI